MSDECWDARESLENATTAHQNAKDAVARLIESRNNMRSDKRDWEGRVSDRQYTANEKKAAYDSAENERRSADQKQQFWQNKHQELIRANAPAEEIARAQRKNRKWYDREEQLRERTVPAARRAHKEAKRSLKEARTEVARLAGNLETIATTIDNKKAKATTKREARDKAQRKVDRVC